MGILLLSFSSVSALCGDFECDISENSENCCIDCGCGFGENCENNECVEGISFFSFSSEVSMFLLAIIIIFGAFVIGYGFNLIRKAHKKTNKHFKKKEECNSNLDLLTTSDIEHKIVDYIKKGKSLKEIKQMLEKKGVSPKLIEDLILEVVDSLVSKSEQDMLQIKWDPQLISSVFKEVMGMPKELREHKKREKKIKNHLKKLDLRKIIKNARKQQNNSLENYIGIAFARGYSTEQIKKSLVKVGWDEKDVDIALENLFK